MATNPLSAIAAAIVLTVGAASCSMPSGSVPVASREGAVAARSRMAGSTAGPMLAVYAWNMDDVIARRRKGTLWPLLASKHVDLVLAGFDSRQIATYSTPSGAGRFNAIIAEGARHGVAFQLLLGDPSWIAPSGHASLISILHRLAPLHFSALNLDLEPNELTGVSKATALRDLVSAMQAYVATSPWPVTLDLNPNVVHGGGYCVICGLERTAKLKRIALMTYIADPEKVIAKDRPILAHHPNVTFDIAQSVEPPSVLPVGDSYWSAGFNRFYADMRVLDATLTATSNHGGIIVESLGYLETIRNR